MDFKTQKQNVAVETIMKIRVKTIINPFFKKKPWKNKSKALHTSWEK